MTGMEKIKQMLRDGDERLDFLNEGDTDSCPSNFGLTEHCQARCGKCWLEALEGEVKSE